MSITYYPGYSQVIVKQNLVIRDILAITNSYPMIVTTVLDHGYVAGMEVTFKIPTQFKMTELNSLDGQVLSITNNTLTINLDSRNFSVFSYPSPLPSTYTPPVVIPNSSGKYLPPLPLPYGNQDSFEGVIYNNGLPSDPVNGV